MELARWLAFRIYLMNPYIKPPRAKTVTQYARLPWEEPTREEAEIIAEDVRVTDEQAAELNRIFDEIYKRREQNNG